MMLFYYTAPKNAAECSIDLNGPAQRSEVCYFFIMTATKK